ncbi:chitinase [Aspergillus sclerotialis]|uniref:chitinase n=1 Tax=Aspergillus sclerotialis TaxID=2070753 RepID=A0A3A2ZLD6_9EURO|nr:chitinase [Aspergillus sclerotialis]
MFSQIKRKLEGRSNKTPAPTTTTSSVAGNRYEVPFFVNAAYYPNWRIYRQQPPSSLRLGVKDDGTVYLSDEWADTQMPVDGTNGCLRAFTQLKQQYSKMKVILSIGGGGKGSDNFALVAGSRSRTEMFCRTARELVDLFGLDGVDIDWEHPSNPTEGNNYIHLLSALRAFFPPPYVLATCLPGSEWALHNIDLAKAARYLDLLNIMAYDFSGPWTSTSGHHAQLKSTSKSPISGQSAVSYVLNQGVPHQKLLLGVPAYGRSFLGCSKPGQSHSGCGGEDGVFDYKDLPRPGAKEGVDEKAGAAFCVGGDGGFVSYDTAKTVQMKARFVVSKRLAGLFYWHIASDARGDRSLLEMGFKTLHEM